MEEKKHLDLDKIKRRISALLDKTVDNGATKEEMNSALEKANALMLEFFITENDLKRDQNQEIIVKCVSKTVDIIKTHYDLSMFRYNLAILFDCASYVTTSYDYVVVKGKHRKITKQTSTFFGYETDVELACYFLQMIERSCIKEKDKFIDSFGYMCLKKQTKAHGKTLISSFITGFVFEVSLKLDELYKDRVRNIPQSYGLMVIEKTENVKKQYEEFQLNFKISKGRKKNYQIGEEQAYEKGLERGKNFELIQGIGEDDDEEEILYL